MLTEPVFAILPRDIVVVEGPEAAEYLQGQITADAKALSVGDASLSMLLDPRGRIEGLFYITHSDTTTFVLDTEPSFGEPLLESLTRFKLRTKAEFTSHSGQMIGLRSPVGTVPTPSSAQEIVRSACWTDIDAVDVVITNDSADQPEITGSQITPAQFEALRLAHGLPVIGTEIEQGAIPNETGLVDWAVSFDKGCYRGQELVERIDSRTGGRRTICRFSTQVDTSAGETLHDNEGSEIGKVLSATPLDNLTVGFVSVRADADETTGNTVGAATAPVQLYELASSVSV